LKEGVGKVHILFAPIGGKTVLDAAEAKDLINQIEPSIVIPMHYHAAKKSENILKEFADEFGQKNIEPLAKLSIRKKDVSEDKGTQIVILSSQ
jgi:L-ascorbate metabolism protein UlaG (beta-lactamase superfamily)